MWPPTISRTMVAAVSPTTSQVCRSWRACLWPRKTWLCCHSSSECVCMTENPWTQRPARAATPSSVTQALQDEARKVGVLCEIADVFINVGRVDPQRLARAVGRLERDFVEHA